jgi:S1-C subfamily serine protease
VVTARHVVADQPPEEAVRVQFADAHEAVARVSYLHPRVDLAVLELMEGGSRGAPLQPAFAHESAVPLLCVGYKPSLGFSDDRRGTPFVSPVAEFEETRRQRDGHEETLFMFPAPDGEPGHSGGPLLTADGRVLAAIINGIDIGGRYFLRATAIGALGERLGFAR